MTTQLHERIERALRTRPREIIETTLGLWFASEPSRDDSKWPRMIDSVYKPIAGEAEASFKAILGSGPAGHVTLRHNLATGQSTLATAPDQAESRIVIDGSSGDRLAAYRGLCRLLGGLEQQLLGVASEVLIVAAPPEWVISNAPHPVAPARLRLVIVLPPEDEDWDHFDDLHRAAHLAVGMARMRAGLATVMWFLSGAYTRVSTPSGHDGKIAMSAAAKLRPPGVHIVLGKNAHDSDTTELLINLSSRVSIQNSRPLMSGRPRPVVIEGGFEATILSTGRPAAYWLGALTRRKHDERPLKIQLRDSRLKTCRPRSHAAHV